jgi:pyroglutamyl-peptidase
MRLRQVPLVIGIFMLIIPFGTLSAAGTKTVLVTGFEPFGSYTTNPSQVVAETLNGSTLTDAEIIGIVLPVNFTTSVERVIAAMEQYHPDIVISLGLNAKSHVIEVEKIGFNLKRYPKDDGTWSFPQRIEKNGPFIRLTSLNTQDIARIMRQAHIPAKQSFFAGTYVCNAVFYGVLGYTKSQDLNTSVGFIHVPLLDSQDPQGLPVETLVDAVKISIEVSLG